MARDIEEFLRRAAERRNQQKQQQQPARRPPQQRQPRRDVVETNEIEIVHRQEPDLREQSVTEHVAQHISSHTQDLFERASHLGDRIQSIDERVAERIHSQFDHDVGKLDDKPTVQDDWQSNTGNAAVSSVALDLVQMLSTPRSVRQAILIAEILNRPNFD